MPPPSPRAEILPHGGPTLTVTMTAYNSLAAQTDATPWITSTGQRTRPGIVAVSRDLLAGPLPYGSTLRVVSVDTQARGCSGWLPGTVLEVQDTMHARKRNQVDLWLLHREDALRWGRCTATVQVLASK